MFVWGGVGSDSVVVVWLGVDSASVVVVGVVGGSVGVVGGAVSVGEDVASVSVVSGVVGVAVDGSVGSETDGVVSSGSSVYGADDGGSVCTVDGVDGSGVAVSLRLGSDGNPPRTVMRTPTANRPIPASTNPPCNRRCFLSDRSPPRDDCLSRSRRDRVRHLSEFPICYLEQGLLNYFYLIIL